MDVQPFKIQISQDALDDLQSRLSRTRWPDEIESAGWEYGASLRYMHRTHDEIARFMIVSC